MRTKRAYQEEIVSLGLFLIFALLTLLMVGAGIAQLLAGPLGDRPAPTFLYWLLGGLFALIALSFHKLVVRIDRKGITARYGLFSRQIRWRDVERLELDESGSFYGYGVRFGRYQGRNAWVFNVIRSPHVVVVTRESGPAALIFSSRRPEEAIRAAEQFLGQGSV